MITKASRPAISIAEIAREAGMSKQTLYGWVRNAKLPDVSSTSKKKRGRPRKASRWSPEKKLRILYESAALSEEGLGAFMRREGLHDTDILEMRTAALAGLAPKLHRHGPSPEEQELGKLKRELRRKERALAEAAALLILQKKFQTLMADEDDAMGETFGESS